MTTVSSTLDIIVKADTSGAKALASALESAQRQAKEVDAALSRSGTTDKLQARLKAIGASATHIEAVATSWKDLAKAEGLAEKAGDWTKQQSAAVKNWENVTVASVRAVMGQERAREIAAVHTAERAEAAAKREAESRAKAAEAEERAVKRQAEIAEAAAKREIEAANRVAEAEERAVKRQTEAAEAAARRRAEVAEVAAKREAESRLRAIEAEERAARRQAEMEARLQHRMDEQRAHAIKAQGIGHYALTGAAMAVSAHGVVHSLEGAAEKGAELQDTRLMMRNAGIDPATARDMERHGLELSTRYANVGQTDIMELAKEARSVLSHPEEVPEVVEKLAAAKSVLDAMDKTGESSGGLGMLVKGSESIGAAQNPERFGKLIDAYVKAIQVMGKTINPEQIYEFDKYAKTAGDRMSDRFLMTTGLSLSQEMGGSTAGNSIAQVQKAIIGGFQNKHVPLGEMARIGMIDAADIVRTKTGEAKGLKPGKQVVGANKAASDLDLWVYEDLLPHMEAHGIKAVDDQLNFISKSFTSTQADVISKLVTQRTAFENHAKLYPQASGIAGAQNNMESATAGLTAFSKALGNLVGNATSPMMPLAGQALYRIADGLNYAAKMAAENPITAAVTAGGAGAAALAGSGYLSYKLLNGFGLGTAATELTASAAALDAAAAKLGGGSLASDVVKTAEGAAGGAMTVGGVVAGALPFIAAAGVGALLEYDTDPSKALVSGGRPDLQLDPSDWLPGVPKGEDATPFRGRPAFPHTPTPRHIFTQEDDPYLGGGRQAIDEQARRSADDFRRDPEAARGNAMMRMDTSGLDAAKQKADETHAALDQINGTTVTPQVNTAGLDTAIAKMRELVALASQVSAAAASAGGGVARASMRAFTPAPAGRTTV